MTGVSGVSPGSSSSQTNSRGLQVNQNQFIELFIAQLKHQDPLAPTDTNQMLTQLSQISSVESLNSIDERIGGLTSSLQQTQALGAVGLVGKEVWVGSNSLTVDETGEYSGQAELQVNASDVLIRVYTPDGTLVQSQSLGQQSAGVIPFTLDELKPGQYIVTATGVNDNVAYTGKLSMKSTVTGVNMTGAGAELKLDGMGSVPLSSISMIGD
ncbi:flagellar hook capping FlgD N-terminal domain-containing protein [Endozoicomonas sp. 4G]|uniref:flagellar hook assembly protein FlgD n=1 Tax=Endozoicomonas sp. 4G TaxID=2872754 RepID=UPI0020787936|nr:flagellar hook capping FlgD N-terminal domain-containing protein [Endozoicomonas sp. 4G]